MNEIVNTQLQLFLYAIAMGVLLGMIYDLTRIFRKAIKHPNFFVQIEDGLYWVICALLMFAILYMHNYGQVRSFMFLGMVLGAMFYFLTFSIIFMKIAVWCIDLIKRTIRWLIHIISIPIKMLIHIISIPLTYLRVQMIKARVFQKRKQHKRRRKRYYEQADRKTEKKLHQLIRERETND